MIDTLNLLAKCLFGQPGPPNKALVAIPKDESRHNSHRTKAFSHINKILRRCHTPHSVPTTRLR